MMVRALVGVAALVPLQLLGAQRATVDVGAIGLRYADSISAGGISLTPAFRHARGSTSLDASATLSQFGSGFSAQGALGASVFSPSRGPFVAELGGTTGGSFHEDGGRTGQAIASLRGHVSGGRTGAWIGGGAGAMNDGFSWRNIRQFEAGAWSRLSPTVSILATVVPTTVVDTIRYVDAQSALSFEMPRASLDLSAGVRGGSGLPALPGASKLWGGATLVAPLTPRAAVVLAAGTYPLDFTQGFPAGRYVSASMRFSGGARTTERISPTTEPAGAISSFTLTRRSSGEIVIEVRAGSATTVEITGDFTQWETRPLTRVRAGVFTITLTVAPGTYQMNVRTDGGSWVVPPGVTAVTDELGARVGIITVSSR